MTVTSRRDDGVRVWSGTTRFYHAKMELPLLGRTRRLVEKEEGKGPIRAILS